MTFKLSVYYENLPGDLKSKWEAAYRKEGFDVRILPEFEAGKWPGGFLPFCIKKAPKEYIGIDLPDIVVSGFEVEFTENAAYFRTPMGSSTTEFALQFFGAALLTKITDGRYIDGHNTLNLSPDEAKEVAVSEIKGYLFTTWDHERIFYPFNGWEALKRGNVFTN